MMHIVRTLLGQCQLLDHTSVAVLADLDCAFLSSHCQLLDYTTVIVLTELDCPY